MCILIAALIALVSVAGLAAMIFAFAGLCALTERWFGDNAPLWVMGVFLFFAFFVCALHDHICHF